MQMPEEARAALKREGASPQCWRDLAAVFAPIKEVGHQTAPARLRGEIMLPWTLAEIEQLAIVGAWRAHNYHIPETAKALGMGRSTIYRKLRDYGVETDGRHQVVARLEARIAQLQVELDAERAKQAA